MTRLSFSNQVGLQGAEGRPYRSEDNNAIRKDPNPARAAIAVNTSSTFQRVLMLFFMTPLLYRKA
jgi:hypothetical protein